MYKEFQAFLLKSNALALALGVIIGVAIGKVISSLVGDVLMPVLGLLIPAGSWREIQIPLTHKPDGAVDDAILLGSFLGNLVDFVIIGFAIFMITKALLKQPEAPPPAVKTCPECKETIPIEAKKCKFCTSPV